MYENSKSRGSNFLRTGWSFLFFLCAVPLSYIFVPSSPHPCTCRRSSPPSMLSHSTGRTSIEALRRLKWNVRSCVSVPLVLRLVNRALFDSFSSTSLTFVCFLPWIVGRSMDGACPIGWCCDLSTNAVDGRRKPILCLPCHHLLLPPNGLLSMPPNLFHLPTSTRVPAPPPSSLPG